MKAQLILSDTPQGIKVELKWRENGVQDNLAQSLSMNLLTNLSIQIRDLETSGALVIFKDKNSCNL